MSFGQVVNDVVLADLHASFFGQGEGAIVGHDVETDDHRVFRGCEGEPNVVFGDDPDAGFEDADADLGVLEFVEFLADRLDGAAEVGLEDDLELVDLGFRSGVPASTAAVC